MYPDEIETMLKHRFEAVGLIEVQRALSSPASNQLFGVPEYDRARRIAHEWVEATLAAPNKRRRQNAWPERIAILAALLGLLASALGAWLAYRSLQ